MDNERAVRLEWTGTDLRFTGRGTHPVTPPILVDGDAGDGPSPMLTLLLAAASCSGADVVAILKKMRVTLRRLSVDVRGVRRETEPRRYVRIAFRYTIGGEGLDRAKAERAVALSLAKYCSVVHSLAPDLHIDHTIELA